jgi:OOP family OmpA-OmpF porin
MKNPRRTTLRLVTSAMLTLACSSATPPPEVVDARPTASARAPGPAASAPPLASPPAELTSVATTPPPAPSSATPTATTPTATTPTATTPTVTTPTVTTPTTTAPPPPPLRLATLDGDRILPTRPLTYLIGKPALTEDGSASLAGVKGLLDAEPDIALVRIEVHTDSMGSDDANMALSTSRALFVARSLVELGVSCRRLIAVGFGETRPIAPNGTAADRAKNRRTEFVVIGRRGRKGPTLPADGGGVVAGDPCL